MPPRTARALLAACLLSLSTAPCAQAPSAAGAPLDLVQAVERALAHNPKLQTFAYRLRAQDGLARTAGLSPPLELRAEAENLLGTGRADGFGAAEITLALSQVIELGGKREGRLDLRRASRSLVEIERDAAQLDVLAEVTRRFIQVAVDQALLQLAQDATALAQQTVAAVQRRVDAAKAPEVELRRARIALVQAQLQQEHADHRLRSARYGLAAMWSAAEPDFGAVRADLDALPPAVPFDALLARLERNPDFLRFASEARLRDAEIRLAQAQARPDLTLSAGLRRLQATQDEAFVVGFGMPLFGRERAAGQIAQAQAQRALTDVEAQAQRVAARAQLFAIYQELRHAITEAELLRGDMVPEMEAALQATRAAFERGRYGYLEWVDAQQELLGLRRALIESSARAHLQRVEIERLTAEPFGTFRMRTP